MLHFRFKFILQYSGVVWDPNEFMCTMVEHRNSFYFFNSLYFVENVESV